MNENWLTVLPKNPLPALLNWTDESLTYFINRDLFQKTVEPVESIWGMAGAVQLVNKQQKDGSWKYPGKTDGSVPDQNYFLLETYRYLSVLVEMYGFNRKHPAIRKAAEYVLSCQTMEGDIRGIIGNQYMPYYHGAILELLIKAGYQDDPRVAAGLEWLLSMRQVDGGWIVPTQVVPSGKRTPQFGSGDPVDPDRSRPHAHMATGMVLRAFAAHSNYQKRPEIIAAGDCLKTRFFEADKYNDRRAPSYWLKFQYPFWWTSLLTSLDTLSRLNYDRNDEDIARGLAWFITNQNEDGLWPTGYDKGRNADANRHWVGLAICRIFHRYFHYS